MIGGETVSHYRILAKLGGGGMGLVYKAEDIRLGRIVALKLLPPELNRDAKAKGRFLREARAASALDHPNICTIYEIGETDDGRLFLAMAYYEGETLRERIAKGPLPIEEASDALRQIALGLARAHRQEILHRDIKPANLLRTSDGELKILDFGLAKFVDDAAITHVGGMPGTPMYMAPEQAHGEVGARSDVFSLGIVAYEMLAGERPFHGQGTAALYGIVHNEPKSLAKLRREVPPALARLVRSMLDKDPHRRPSAAEVAVGIERASAFLMTREDGNSVGRIFLSGGGARIPGMSQTLARRMDVETEVVNPFERVPVRSGAAGEISIDAAAPMLLLPLGLALRA